MSERLTAMRSVCYDPLGGERNGDGMGEGTPGRRTGWRGAQMCHALEAERQRGVANACPSGDPSEHSYRDIGLGEKRVGRNAAHEDAAMPACSYREQSMDIGGGGEPSQRDTALPEGEKVSSATRTSVCGNGAGATYPVHPPRGVGSTGTVEDGHQATESTRSHTRTTTIPRPFSDKNVRSMWQGIPDAIQEQQEVLLETLRLRRHMESAQGAHEEVEVTNPTLSQGSASTTLSLFAFPKPPSPLADRIRRA